MPSARDIRRRIKSVKNIQQITRAMKMVAAARLRRAQERAIASRPYTEKIRALLASIAASANDLAHPLLELRDSGPDRRTGFLVLSADKGLAGPYSANLIREAVGQIAARSAKERAVLVVAGKKGRDYFVRRGYNVLKEYTGFSEKPAYSQAAAMAAAVADAYLAGTFDAIYLVYTEFLSPASFRPVTIRLLPIDYASVPERSAGAEGGEGEGGEHGRPVGKRSGVTRDVRTGAAFPPVRPGMHQAGAAIAAAPGPAGPVAEYIFAPSAPAVLELLLPKYLETVIFGALLQSAAAELAARTAAMSAATDNAQELITKLILNYNKVRQATITREIAEIVGGAEALK